LNIKEFQFHIAIYSFLYIVIYTNVRMYSEMRNNEIILTNEVDCMNDSAQIDRYELEILNYFVSIVPSVFFKPLCNSRRKIENESLHVSYIRIRC